MQVKNKNILVVVYKRLLLKKKSISEKREHIMKYLLHIYQWIVVLKFISSEKWFSSLAEPPGVVQARNINIKNT